MMKKISVYVLLAFIVGLFSFTSCSSDDNGGSNPSKSTNNLIGKWNLNVVDVKIHLNDEMIQHYEDMPASELLEKMQFDFYEDGTVDYVLVEDGNSEELSGTYEQNGNNLVIILDDEPQTFEIVLNDEDNLHLFTEEIDDEVQGNVINTQVTFKYIKM